MTDTEEIDLSSFDMLGYNNPAIYDNINNLEPTTFEPSGRRFPLTSKPKPKMLTIDQAQKEQNYAEHQLLPAPPKYTPAYRGAGNQNEVASLGSSNHISLSVTPPPLGSSSKSLKNQDDPDLKKRLMKEESNEFDEEEDQPYYCFGIWAGYIGLCCCCLVLFIIIVVLAATIDGNIGRARKTTTPTKSPTFAPTFSPTTPQPTMSPTENPTISPTASPTTTFFLLSTVCLGSSNEFRTSICVNEREWVRCEKDGSVNFRDDGTFLRSCEVGDICPCQSLHRIGISDPCVLAVDATQSELTCMEDVPD